MSTLGAVLNVTSALGGGPFSLLRPDPEAGRSGPLGALWSRWAPEKRLTYDGPVLVPLGGTDFFVTPSPSWRI